MAREIDRRDPSVNRVTPARQSELEARAVEASRSLPGTQRVRIARFDATTGNPSVVTWESMPAEKGNYIRRALDHVQSAHDVLGFADEQPPEFAADPHTQETSSGAVTVHLQQLYKSIPIFQASETVRFAPDGSLLEAVGSSVTVDQEQDVRPSLTVQEAVMSAARYVAAPHPDEQVETDQFGEPLVSPAIDLNGFTSTVLATFHDKADHPSVIEAGPFEENIAASLIWFPLDGELRLAWEVILTMPNYHGKYRTLVDAADGDILYCAQMIHVAAARGNVYRVDAAGARQLTDFPRPLTEYDLPVPVNLPNGFPEDWVETDRSVGNSVRARLGTSNTTAQGDVQNGIVNFDPSDPFGDDQKVLNIFYFNCVMHNFFYLLGFREADGNFQHNNLGRGGAAADRVDARAHSGPVYGTANMGTPIDGFSPIMNMGLVERTGRHTAFDSSVVFHEFTHGVTNRLVGGRLNDHALEAPQSRGMGEGWGDYIACSINNTNVVGAWVVNRPNGLRHFPYTSGFPDNFSDLGTGRYTADREHDIGEIWAATLMETNRNIGMQLSLQLVVDALKLAPANPSFLDMRDAILRALDNQRSAGIIDTRHHTMARKGIWAAFAKFGMGPNASSNGASVVGIMADFNPPNEEPGLRVEVTPNIAIPDNDPVGVTTGLQVLESGRISQVMVAVDIQHTFIGDLQVTLQSPDGQVVILHDRTGSGTNDLVRGYTSADIPELTQFAGQEVQGDWSLKVADVAGADIGVLRRWGLDLALEATSQVVRGESTPGITIPDNDPTGVSSTISLTEVGTIQHVEIGVDITHPFIGDLRVEVVPPSGPQAILHNRGGGNRDNLITTFDSSTTPGLTALIGQPIQGVWVLRVTDRAGRDTGKFNGWNLKVTVSE